MDEMMNDRVLTKKENLLRTTTALKKSGIMMDFAVTRPTRMG